MQYLVAEMIPLCLFSDAVENDHKRAVADALLAKMTKKGTLLPKARFGTGYGKPIFPGKIGLETELADLVTEDSWFLFRLLELNPEFLNQEVTGWSTNPAYLSSQQNVLAMNVVNDCAERRVNLGSDFQQ